MQSYVIIPSWPMTMMLRPPFAKFFFGSSLRADFASNIKPNAGRWLSTRASAILTALDLVDKSGNGVEIPAVFDGEWKGAGEIFESVCPATKEILARVRAGSPDELQQSLLKAREAYKYFKDVPGPQRGEIVRQIREAIATKRNDLGALVSLEMGKIRTEGVGEVQEFIDICDYAVGLSRMMNGRIINSERLGHSIMEVPNPLGVVAVLSAFNFPVAVYGWNLALSMAAGNATIWKPSPTTPLCSIAVTKIIADVLKKNNIPGAVAGLFIGGKDVGEAVVESKEVDLVSFTGSELVGRQVGKVVQARFGKVLLELGGNNAAIVCQDADLSLAIPSVFFGAIGTAGQRCTSTRRLYIHRSIASSFIERLQGAYKSVKPGDPLVEGTLLGPMHTEQARKIHNEAVGALKNCSAEILAGSDPIFSPQEVIHAGRYLEHGFFVRPVLAVLPPNSSDEPTMLREIWNKETFAPILKVSVFDELEEAIMWNNSVPQGLSSSLWTKDVRNVGKWIGPGGSDCGIVNVNVGTSGAEIGAAFGGNKSTGWGRESGGDAWKQYVRWSACTINFSDQVPLAQGVNFSLPSS